MRNLTDRKNNLWHSNLILTGVLTSRKFNDLTKLKPVLWTWLNSSQKQTRDNKTDSFHSTVTSKSNQWPITRSSSSRRHLSESKALRKLDIKRHNKVLRRPQIKYSTGKIHSKGTSTIHRRRQELLSMQKIIFRPEFRKLFKTFCSRITRRPTLLSKLNNSRTPLKLFIPQIQRSS